MACLLGGQRPPMTLQGPLVLGLAADGIPASDHLRRLSETDRRVPLSQPWIDHPPADRAVVQSLAPPREVALRFLQDVRGTSHALDTAGQKTISITGLDLAGGRHHRLHP